MKLVTQIVWFKRDLRLDDHAPLASASAAGPILPLYIIEPEYWQLPDVSRRHWHFIHDSLRDLQSAFNTLNIPFATRIGSVITVLESLRLQYGNIALWSHEETGNGWTYARDKVVALWCREQGCTWHEFQSNGVVRRLTSRKEWSKLRTVSLRESSIPIPNKYCAAENIKTETIPAKDDPLFGEYDIGRVQTGGFKQAANVLNSFLRYRSQGYLLTISKPGISARHCSRLSAHIAYGNLSVRQIEHAVIKRRQELSAEKSKENISLVRNLDAFLSRLAWRCHFVQKLEQQPEMEYKCLHPSFEGMREPHFNAEFFSAWKEGRTGYPLVDACMRSLKINGWITFRMRAMLVSFASYHLWLDWRVTAPYLAQLFTDYEPGIHYSQFQMQSGVTGMNAIRMYNPVKQSKDHDPEGQFIRKYLPELRQVPPEFIHEPWLMDEPPANYPQPIVDHETAIRFAREEIRQRWHSSDFESVSKKLLTKLGSRRKKSTREKKTKVKKNNPQLELDI